jgi:hypothetical protein
VVVAFIKAVVIVGVNALLISGKKKESINVFGTVFEVKSKEEILYLTLA